MITHRSSTNPRLMRVGAAAGPLFIVSTLVQAKSRTGFDLAQLPPSALALGDRGWLQQVTFVACGIGFTAAGIGLRRHLAHRPGGTAGWFVGIFGAALIAGGIFSMDPAFGFPPGTPDGIGPTVSWHAAIHGVMFPLGFLAALAASWSLARHYSATGQPLLKWLARFGAPIATVLAITSNLYPDPQGHFEPMWLGVVLLFGWLSFMLDNAATAAAPGTATRSRRTLTQGDDHGGVRA